MSNVLLSALLSGILDKNIWIHKHVNMILTQQPGCAIECFKFRTVGQGKYQTVRDEVLEYSLKLLKDKGACMVKDAMIQR